MTTYTAAIATASDCVLNGYCDVTVLTNEIAGYREDSNGNEVPVHEASGPMVMNPVDTDVTCDDDDKLTKAQDAAETILNANGWTITGTWEIADNAMYAAVERI